jgi:hypothetical protein
MSTLLGSWRKSRTGRRNAAYITGLPINRRLRISMNLDDAISEAITHFDAPPLNEANTCDWVIYPLLLAIGYARREIDRGSIDNNSQYPDYTILPRTSHTWYLEAKSWTTELKDIHAQQALNYANQNAGRWVVLTNGRTWRLFDDTIRGLASEKLILSANLADPKGIRDFLHHLGKSSITTDSLDTFVRITRLHAVLAKQMTDPDSECIRALFGTVRKQPHLAQVTRHEVTSYFGNFIMENRNPQISTISGKQPIEPDIPADALKTFANEVEMPQLEKTHNHSVTLEEIWNNINKLARGRKPMQVVLPDGTEVPIQSWAECAEKVIGYVYRVGGGPPLPYQGQLRGERYFLNTEPKHTNSDMKSPRPIANDIKTIFMESHFSATDLVQRVLGVCEHANIHASTFLVQLKPG